MNLCRRELAVDSLQVSMHISEPEHSTTNDLSIATTQYDPAPFLKSVPGWRTLGTRRLCLWRPIAWILVLLFGPLACGQPVKGWWKATRKLKDGTNRPVLFEFSEAKSRLIGTVRFDWGDLAIQNGIIEDGHLSFSVGMLQFSGSKNSSGITLLLQNEDAPDQVLTLSPMDEKALQLPSDRAPLPPLKPVQAPIGVANTPPMGWNSWNYFHHNISDAIIREVADAIASNGMREAGYSYIVIDDGWQGKRDTQGRLQPNSGFPDMKKLADYVHTKGLKLGIYSSPGPQTCGKFEGSYQHEQQDAETFAVWGIDFLKYDWCSASRVYKPSENRAVFQKMGSALHSAGRPILFSLCQYGMEDVWLWGPDVGASTWRTTNDIKPSFRSMHQNALNQRIAAHFAGPGHWNDPDMLEIGNGTMNEIEGESHLSLWAMLAAPLIAGNDVRKMTEATRRSMLNKQLIAIDQDPLGKQAVCTHSFGDIEVWQRPLANGDHAVLILNASSGHKSFQAEWKDLGVRQPKAVFDVWSPTEQVGTDNLELELQPHESHLFRLSFRVQALPN